MAVNELLCYDVAYFKKDKEYYVESAWATSRENAVAMVKNRHPLENLTVNDVHLKGDYNDWKE